MVKHAGGDFPRRSWTDPGQRINILPTYSFHPYAQAHFSAIPECSGAVWWLDALAFVLFVASKVKKPGQIT
jgi:hypothetical protein